MLTRPDYRTGPLQGNDPTGRAAAAAPHKQNPVSTQTPHMQGTLLAASSGPPPYPSYHLAPKVAASRGGHTNTRLPHKLPHLRSAMPVSPRPCAPAPHAPVAHLTHTRGRRSRGARGYLGVHGVQLLLEGRLGLRPFELEGGRQQPVLHREGLGVQVDGVHLRRGGVGWRLPRVEGVGTWDMFRACGVQRERGKTVARPQGV